MPRYALATGDFRILLNVKGDTLVQVFDGTTNRHLGSFGSRGDGPGEYQSVWDYSASGDSLWLFDLSAQRLTFVDVRRALDSTDRDTGGVIETVQLQSAGNSEERAQHVTVLASRRFAATGAFADGRVHIFSREGRLLGRSGTTIVTETLVMPPRYLLLSVGSTRSAVLT
jgi:hypothetical protein